MNVRRDCVVLLSNRTISLDSSNPGAQWLITSRASDAGYLNLLQSWGLRARTFMELLVAEQIV